MRLDRFVCKHTEHSHQTARRLVASGRASVNGQTIRDPHYPVSHFCTVMLDNRLLQQQQAVYLMLNKPPGYLSATRDPEHPTVLELLPEALRPQLHIAGRLDRATTGLLLLTNDGHWSRRITAPEEKIPKVYRVTTAEPISLEAEACFAQGIWLAREGVRTSAAQLERLGARQCCLTIYEGRHHQVKRMFAAIGNEVTALHRERMGTLLLDKSLRPGEYRALTDAEMTGFQDLRTGL
ncbi:pseudouridine synthase [Marinobacterium weihaiense]|uniref:Pseudouridine synthase n=1 Tax=Marinobacterium weihaiense TaxID=2851016 RepID=A0ABS6MF25_9GAMM|nr:pseudouridine synthase [Marinobacterium weihaiense]MBV0934910.1 pseudouridine synthase [Marinobacterium weihaiense]